MVLTTGGRHGDQVEPAFAVRQASTGLLPPPPQDGVSTNLPAAGRAGSTTI